MTLTFETWPLVERWLDEWYPCNPSIAHGPDGYAAIVTCRAGHQSHDGIAPYHFSFGDGVFRTRNFFARLDEDLRPRGSWEELDAPDVPVLFGGVRGIEDPRLYWQDGWRYSGSIREHHPSGDHRVARCSVESGLIDIIDAPAGEWIKNQMPTGGEPEFIDAMRSNRELHGGAVIPFGEAFLGVIHEVRWPGRIYMHSFAEFDTNGLMSAMSEPFRFGPTSIEFAAGIVLHNEDVVISYGAQDKEARLARIPLASVLEALQ